MLPGLIEGRIVHYVLPDGCSAGAHRPAIVVNAWPQLGRDDGYSNLMVFVDFDNDGVPGGLLWATSKTHSEGKEPGTWHWPEKTSATQIPAGTYTTDSPIYTGAGVGTGVEVVPEIPQTAG